MLLGDDSSPPSNAGTNQSQATALSNLAAGAEFWHSADGTAYATIEVETWHEHWRLHSRAFAQWLARRHYDMHHTAPKSNALAVLEAKARFEGQEHQVFSRVAGHEGQIYLDLVDRRWRAVAIGPGYWNVVERPPVRFRRANAVLALPETLFQYR